MECASTMRPRLASPNNGCPLHATLRVPGNGSGTLVSHRAVCCGRKPRGSLRAALRERGAPPQRLASPFCGLVRGETAEATGHNPCPPTTGPGRPPLERRRCAIAKSTDRAIGSHTYEYCGREFTPYIYVNLSTN